MYETGMNHSGMLCDVAGVPGENRQRFTIFDGDVLTFNRQHTAFLETSQQTADGLNGQAQVVTDIATRHRQTEFTWRETTFRETAGEVVDKRGQALFCILLESSRIMS